MKKEPLVSIIMPTYNREKTLPRAIKSVLKQTYKNWELLIVDDRSTDKTHELINKYSEKDSRIKYLLNKRSKGPGGTRNYGMIHAKGKHVAFLDSDDEWYNHHLKRCVNVLETEDVKICTALWREEGKGKYQEDNLYTLEKVIKILKPRKKDKLIFFDERLPEQRIINNFYSLAIGSFVFRKNILNTIGLMNERLLSAQDVEFTFRMILNFNICLIKEYHMIWHEGEDNIFNFKDSKNLRNPKIIKKFSFCKKYAIKSYKLMKKNVKKSKRITNKKSCIKKINYLIRNHCFSLSKINKKNNILKSASYFLKAIYYIPISKKIGL